MGGLVVVLRIKGNVGIDPSIRKTLESLRLKKAFTAGLYPMTPPLDGMLKKARNYLTWGRPNRQTISTFLKKTMYVTEERLEEFAERLEKCQENLQKPLLISLKPPSKGFKKSLKRDFKSGGEYGGRGEEINELLRRMF